MITDVNSTLEALERTLKGVDSAKEQVEKTVQAYSSVCDAIKVYGDSMKGISDELCNVYDLIKSRQSELSDEAQAVMRNVQNLSDSALAQYKTALESTTITFEQNTRKTLNDFGVSIAELGEKARLLSKTKEELQDALSDVKAFRGDMQSLSDMMNEAHSLQCQDLSLLTSDVTQIKSNSETIGKAVYREAKTLKMYAIINAIIVAACLLLTLLK